MTLFDPGGAFGVNPYSLPSVPGAGPKLRSVALHAQLTGGDGLAAPAGMDIYLTAFLARRPLVKGSAVVDAEPFNPPPTVDVNGHPFPAAVSLLGGAAYTGPAYPVGITKGGGTIARHTQTDNTGAFTIHVATPSALAYSGGARTDADIDPARGGRYTAAYYVMIGAGDMIPIVVDESAIINGVLDISSQLAGAGV